MFEWGKEQLKKLTIIPAIFISSGLLVFMAVYIYWLKFGDFPVSTSVERWGQFGDYIGGVLNPGLSFISIILVCFTLYTTSRQSMIQSFESVLFELLRYHKEHLNNINVSYEEGTYRGLEALEWYITEVKFNYLNLSNDEFPAQERIKYSIDKIYTEDGFFSNTGHYFRNLYHIFKHIDESRFLSEKERVKYAKLVRAQLSSIESGALMLNGLSTMGSNSKNYIQKYSLLQEFTINKPFRDELETSGIFKLYLPEAFRDQKGIKK